MELCDIVIVGAGLVGSALAIALAKRGIGVTVLERNATIPDVLRGELVMPAGVAVLETLGLRESLASVCVETEGVVLHHSAFPSGAHTIDYALALPPAPVTRGLAGWRRPLYEALRAALRHTPGATLTEGFEIVGATRAPDRRIRLEARDASRSPVSARLVIAADGAGSRLARLVGFEPAIASELHVVQGFVGYAPRYARRHVHVGAHPLGAAFVFPFPDGHFRSTFEYGASHRDAVRGDDPLARHKVLLREALPALWGELGAEAIDVRSPLAVQPCKTSAFAGIVEDGFALVGDAAGALDPFAGHGMALGLMDAMLLAEVIAAADGDYSARSLRVYERRRHARIAARREGMDFLSHLFLDAAEGFAAPLGAKLGARWRDADWLAPMLAREFAGYDPALEPSVGLRMHALGLV